MQMVAVPAANQRKAEPVFRQLLEADVPSRQIVCGNADHLRSAHSGSRPRPVTPPRLGKQSQTRWSGAMLRMGILVQSPLGHMGVQVPRGT